MSIALLGTGYWGKNLARVFNEMSLLTSICDSDFNRASEFSKIYDVPVLSFEEILESDCLAVAISLPAELHFETAKLALLSGKHVFVEKPLALNASDALRLVNLAEKNNLILMVGHILQFHNGFIKFKDIIKNKEFGELLNLVATRQSFGKIRSNENVLWSFAPHDISMILSLVDAEIEEINGQCDEILQKNICDRAQIELQFSNGINAKVNVSWLSHNKQQTLVATTDQALIIFDDTQPWPKKLSIINYNGNLEEKPVSLKKLDEFFIEVPSNEPLKSELQFFWKLVQGASYHSPNSGREGLKVVEVLEKADRCLKKP